MAPKVDEHVRAARRIIDANSYLTLATADAGGRPWATPVWFAQYRYTDYLWVSRPSARRRRPATRCRLYLARASAHHLLDAHDHRVPVDLSTQANGSTGGDPWPSSSTR